MANNKKGSPSIPDIQTLIQAGINPNTGLPLKLDDGLSARKSNVKLQLRVLDEQNAVNRYVWYNLPCNLTSQELERFLYYKGQLCFFYMEETDEFYFMPYALDGTIDFYGRYNRIHPVPMAEGVSNDEGNEINQLVKNQSALLSTKKLRVVYDVPMEDVDPDTNCVLLYDYTRQRSETVIPRQQIQDPLLDIMADCIPFMRTGLLNSTGVLGMRVNQQDEYSNVLAASRAIDRAALNGDKYIPIVGNVDFQELTGSTVANADSFMMAMQSLDNFRLSLYGLDNGGLFQKKSHMLQDEQDMNQGNVNLVLNDGLAIRQHFCDVANAIWGLGISCEISEVVLGVDMNGDGVVEQDQDQSGLLPGEQMEGVENAI